MNNDMIIDESIETKSNFSTELFEDSTIENLNIPRLVIYNLTLDAQKKFYEILEFLLVF